MQSIIGFRKRVVAQFGSALDWGVKDDTNTLETPTQDKTKGHTVCVAFFV
jgi:hypothetical protein